MTALGLPDFGPVQANVAWNAAPRHDPRDARRAVGQAGHGRLRPRVRRVGRPARGRRLRHDVRRRRSSPAWRCSCRAGVGNGYQTLADATAYTYLVNDHWRPDAPTSRSTTPTPRSRSPGRSRSAERDPVREGPHRAAARGGRARCRRARRWCSAPTVSSAAPWPRRSRAPRGVDPGRARPRPTPTRSSAGRGTSTTWCSTPRRTPRSTRAETPEGRRAAWAVNADGPAALARLAGRHGFTLVHFSTDYVYDGTRAEHDEDEPLAPLGRLRPDARPRATSPSPPRHATTSSARRG